MTATMMMPRLGSVPRDQAVKALLKSQRMLKPVRVIFKLRLSIGIFYASHLTFDLAQVKLD